MNDLRKELETKLDGLKTEIEKVYLEEIDLTVYCRGMDMSDLSSLDSEQFEVDAKGNVSMNRDHNRERILVRGLCDKDGKRLYSDNDIALVSKFPMRIMRQAYDTIERLSGRTRLEQEKIQKKSVSAGTTSF